MLCFIVKNHKLNNFGRREIPEFSVTVCPVGDVSEGATSVHGYSKRYLRNFIVTLIVIETSNAISGMTSFC